MFTDQKSDHFRRDLRGVALPVDSQLDQNSIDLKDKKKFDVKIQNPKNDVKSWWSSAYFDLGEPHVGRPSSDRQPQTVVVVADAVQTHQNLTIFRVTVISFILRLKASYPVVSLDGFHVSAGDSDEMPDLVLDEQIAQIQFQTDRLQFTSKIDRLREKCTHFQLSWKGIRLFLGKSRFILKKIEKYVIFI